MVALLDRSSRARLDGRVFHHEGMGEAMKGLSKSVARGTDFGRVGRNSPRAAEERVSAEKNPFERICIFRFSFCDPRVPPFLCGSAVNPAAARIESLMDPIQRKDRSSKRSPPHPERQILLELIDKTGEHLEPSGLFQMQGEGPDIESGHRIPHPQMSRPAGWWMNWT